MPHHAWSIQKEEQCLLLTWIMSHAFSGKDRKGQKPMDTMSNPLYFRKEGHSGNDTDQKWEYDHWKARDATKGLRYDSIVHRWLTDPQFQESQWSHGWTEETVDTWTTSPPSASSISKQGQKIKVSQHARVEVQRWEESRKDVNSRRIYTCSPITCCYQTPGRMGKPLHSEVEKRKANTAR